MDWGTYQHYQPWVLGLPSERSKAQAAAEFDHLMSERSERTKALSSLLATNGITLTAGDADIASVNRWFFENIAPYSEDPERPEPMWYSVILDLGLFLGDVIISRSEGLRWEMAKVGGKRNPSFQRHVVSGFPPEGMNIQFDTDLRLAAYGASIVRGEAASPNEFLVLLGQAAQMAAAQY